MKYDFTIQPNPVRIPGIEAKNDAQARDMLQEIMDSQTDRILEAVRQSRWTVTLVQSGEVYIHAPDAPCDPGTEFESKLDCGMESESKPDSGVEATEKTDDILEENLFA